MVTYPRILVEEGARQAFGKMPKQQHVRRFDNASDRIRQAATMLFKTRGYHGTGVRALAAIVNLEPGSLYHHFPSKQHILFDNVASTVDAFLNGLRKILESEPSPEARLRAAVRFHVFRHIDRQNESFISHAELRSLSATNYRRILVKRDHYERLWRELLSTGVDAGVFQIADVALTTTAILTMCSCVADWFAPGGRLSAEEVTEYYIDVVLRLVGFGATVGTDQHNA
jgi:AcrR family transcriptional regulator